MVILVDRIQAPGDGGHREGVGAEETECLGDLPFGCASSAAPEERPRGVNMIHAKLTPARQWLVCAFVCLAGFGCAATARAQATPGIEGAYLTVDGKPAFITGANYIPSSGWILILAHWNPEVVDRDMAALHNLGITSVRFPPLWPLLEPEYGKVSQEKLDRVDELVSIAHRHGISVTIGPITGWMSGATFIPRWADGELFTDPVIVKGEQTLAGAIARRLKDNPGLLGYDFGNEVSAMAGMMRLDPTPAETDRWMGAIYQAFHDADASHPATDGLGGFGGSFDINGIAAHADYLPVHYYPYFSETLDEDPWIGQRTTYGVNYLVSYAAMTGKPVLVQEIGCSEYWAPPDVIGKFLRLTLLSAWAQGAAGYFWWASHNIDRGFHVPQEYFVPQYSGSSFANGSFDKLEYSMGLLDTQNHPKPYALEYSHWIGVIQKLGMGWKNELPVAYVLFPEHGDGWKDARRERTAFTLVKQAHMEARMWPEGKAVPADAAAVVIPGFGLGAAGKAAVRAYLEKGGVVYQSWAGDFPDLLMTKDAAAAASSPVLIAVRSAGLVSIGEHVRVHADLKLAEAAPQPGAKVELLLGTAKAPGAARVEAGESALRGVFFKASLGKGAYYYLAANLEEALAKTYDPWDEDDADLIYSALRPEGGIGIDSKFVELVVKARGSERVLLLLNHSHRSQDVVVKADAPLQLEDYANHAALGSGTEIPLHLTPGEVLVAEVR